MKQQTQTNKIEWRKIRLGKITKLTLGRKRGVEEGE
jgi:hypothetical protein